MNLPWLQAVEVSEPATADPRCGSYETDGKVAAWCNGHFPGGRERLEARLNVRLGRQCPATVHGVTCSSEPHQEIAAAPCMYEPGQARLPNADAMTCCAFRPVFGVRLVVAV